MSSKDATSGKDSPRNKTKKMKLSPATEPPSISSLPDELLLYCLARVSRIYHPTLSSVCKRFRSLIGSPELYKTRSLLNCTEKCLYFCLQYFLDPQRYWFTLYKTANQTSYRLFPIRSQYYLPPALSSSLVAVDSNIYKIGGADCSLIKISGKMPTSSFVSVLDCCSHEWNQAPNMQVERNFTATSSTVDGKIYVAGGCQDKSSKNWVEVFNPKTQTWGSVTNPNFEGGCVVKSLGFDGKFYLFGDHECVVYDPKEGRWNEASGMRFSVKSSYGVIDKVLFIWDHGLFKWYDTKVSSWKKLNGLEKLYDFRNFRGREFCKIVDLGGKMAVLWEELVFYDEDNHNLIWCAEIALEKRKGDDGDEYWGKVNWHDVVLNILAESSLYDQDVLSATV